MGNYNPNAPLVVGNEYAPVLQSDWRPDLFVERGYSFIIEIDQPTIWASMFVQTPPPWPVPGHAYLWTLYQRGQETATGPMKTVLVPLLGLDASSNVLNENGTAAAANRIQAIGDSNYIRFRTGSTNESYVRLVAGAIGTDPFAAVTDKRIVDVSIMYTASAQSGNETPVPLEVNMYNIDRSERLSYGTAQVDLRESFITAIRRSRWGEISTWINATDNPFTESTSRYPWSAAQLSNFADGGNGQEWAVEFRTASAVQDGPREIYLHYAAMQITYCEDNRVGSMGMVCGSDYVDPDQTFVPNFSGYRFGMNYPNQYGHGFIEAGTLAGDGLSWFDIGVNTLYNGTLTLTLKRADYGAYNNQGEPPLLRGLRTVDVFPGHPGVAITNTIEPGQVSSIEITDLVPQIVPQDEAAVGQSDWEAPVVPAAHPYGVQVPLMVYRSQDVVQELVQTSDSTAVEHPQLRFWVRYQTTPTAPLVVQIETQNQTAVDVTSLSVAEIDAFPEVADGWRQVDILVDPALLVDDDGTVLTPAAPRWTSNTGNTQAWQILGSMVINYATDFPASNRAFDTGAPAETGQATYGDQDAEGGIEGSEPATQDLDVSVAWGQAMPAVAGLVVELALQPVAVVDPACPIPLGCIPDGIQYLSLSWTAIDSGYDFVGLGNYELQRQDDTMEVDEWEVVALPIHPLVDSFDDYEARVGVVSRYRIRYVHQNGMVGPWSASVELEIPLGVTGVNAGRGVLIFTSNSDPSRNLAYVQVWNGAPNEDFEFVEAATRDLQRMYGRDFQVAFRPLERGGVQFSRTLMVNAATIPVETLYEGFASLRDLAWADLPYVCVRSERGDRWLANVNVPSGNIRNRRKLYVAEVQITEVSDQPFAPEPSTCEGMTARGYLPSTVYEPRYASTPYKAALDTNDADFRTQIRLDVAEQTFPLGAQFNQHSANGWVFRTAAGNALNFRIRDFPGGDLEAEFQSDPVPFLPGDLFWVRVVYDMDGGGATSTAQFYTSPDGVTWTPLTTTVLDNDSVAVTNTQTVLYPLTVGAAYDGSADLRFGSFLGHAGGAGGWNGVIGEFQMIGDGGVMLANPRFNLQEAETTEFVDDPGNIWTVFGGICTVDRRL